MNDKYIDQITKFWILLYRLFSPFKIFWSGSTLKEDKDGGDVYEERCTVGGSNRSKDKNDKICS